jgi:cellulose synthase operon protein C
VPEIKLSNPRLSALVQKAVDSLNAPDPPVNPQRDAYRKAACVFVAFNPFTLKPFGMPSSIEGAAFNLLDDCTVVNTHGQDKVQWSLKSDVRREALKSLGNPAMFSQALETNPQEKAQTPLQKVYETCLSGVNVKPLIGTMSREELQSAMVACNWLEGILPELPRGDDIRRRLDRLQLFSQFEHLTIDGFAGRESEMDELRNHVGVRPAITFRGSLRRKLDFFRPRTRAPYALWGPGGVGKSTLIAQFILEHAAVDEEAQFPYVYLDFDSGAIGLDRNGPLLSESLRMLQMQYPDQAELIERFRSRTTPFLKGERGTLADRDDPALRLESLSAVNPEDQVRLDTFFTRGLARLIERMLENTYGKSSDHPFLIVLDTFENVQHTSEARVKQIWNYLELLRGYLPRLRVVVSGRDPVLTKGLPGPAPQSVSLGNLDREAADVVLRKNGVEDASKFTAIYRLTGGNPLSLRLAAAAYKQGNLDTSLTTTFKAQFQRQLSSGESIIQGQLYDRILNNIPEKNVRQLASPGLALRLITARIIMEVLREPCKIQVASIEEAEELLTKLEKASLVFREGDALRHRSDVRKVMLPSLDKDKPGLVRRINEKAVEFYEQEDAVRERTEEIYHRLRLGQGSDIIDQRWMTGIEDSLRGAVDELPTRSQVYLSRRLHLEVSKDLLARLNPDEWEQIAASKARDFIAHGNIEEARSLLAERSSRSENSPLHLVEAELAAVTKDWQVAQEKVELAQQAAHDSGDMRALLQATNLGTQIAVQTSNPVLADKLAQRATELAEIVDDKTACLRALVLRFRLQAQLTNKEAVPVIRAGIREVFNALMYLGDRDLLRGVALAMAGEYPNEFINAFRAGGLGQVSRSATERTIKALLSWAKKKDLSDFVPSLLQKWGFGIFLGEVVNGEPFPALPSDRTPQALQSILEELLLSFTNDLDLQRIVALALEDPALGTQSGAEQG